MDIKTIMEAPTFSQKEKDDETHVRHQFLGEVLDMLVNKIREYDNTMDEQTDKAYENLYEHIEHLIKLEAYNYGR